MIFSFLRGGILSIFLIFSISQITDIFAVTTTKEATYYSDSFQGAQTANGETFDQKIFSAAMCDTPLGQYLYVSKGGTGIVVDLNDRPNCSRYPNVIDLNSDAFKVFSPLSAGRLSGLTVTPIGPSPTKSPKTFLDASTFEHLGVILTSKIPTVLFAGEGIEIRGRVTTNNQYVLIYAQRDGGTPVNLLVKVASDKTFQGFIELPKITGDIVFVVASGNSFDTNKYATLTLIEKGSLMYPSIPENTRFKITPKVTNYYGSNSNVKMPEGISADLVITQGKKRYTANGKVFVFKNLPFTSGNAQVKISGYSISTPSSLDRSLYYPNLFSGTVLLERMHEVIGKESVIIQNKSSFAKYRFKTPSSYRIRSNYYITTPKGEVRELHFAEASIATDGFLKPGITVTGTIDLDSTGTYLFEIVREDGVAFANIPITRGVAWPVLSPLTDTEISTIRKDIKLVESSTVKRINTLRKNLGRNEVTIDTSLTTLAQAKVEDMIRRGYQGHADPNGNYIDYLAMKLGISPVGSIGENIGYGTVSDLSLQDGLEESGVHRQNMMNPKWKKVGIGYSVNQGKVYLVHVFGE